SFFIAVVNRATNPQERFMSVPAYFWPLVYTVVMAGVTAYLTGGIGLHTLGGETGGGKKYLSVVLALVMFLALTSYRIPVKYRSWYIAAFFLSASPALIGDICALLPSPFTYVNLVIPLNEMIYAQSQGAEVSVRFAGLAMAAQVSIFLMLAKWGLQGIYQWRHPFRLVTFHIMLVATTLGGFRSMLAFLGLVLFCLFIMERLYRTAMLAWILTAVIVVSAIVLPFAEHMPKSLQRSMAFLPVKIDPDVRMDADGSKEWRERIWSAIWPQVPGYLLLGKGYALRAEDFELMGSGSFAGVGVNVDATQEGLAISMDYHNGPLSTLMPFGIWGAISYIWLAAAGLFILYRNYRYGEPALLLVNRMLLVLMIGSVFSFLFIFGAYCDDLGKMARLVGFSVALNWGVKAPPIKKYYQAAIRRLPNRHAPQPLHQPAA
ncbi:MAG TPA: O-antigen ligase family protein, partial [Verrucomicrobiae bacterium]